MIIWGDYQLTHTLRDVARALKRGGPPFFLGQIFFDVVIRMC